VDDERRFRGQERLHKRRQYLDVYGRGRKIHCPHFVIYVLENGLDYHRLGITVSRKVGKAVVRNKIKRRLREVFRANKPNWNVHVDMVLNVKRSAAQAAFEKLWTDFREALNRLEKETHHGSAGCRPDDGLTAGGS
jgi:ribonuclease P protein component